MQGINRKLATLRFENVLTELTPETFKQVIMWLEEHYIALYHPRKRRTRLCRELAVNEWFDKELYQYITSLDSMWDIEGGGMEVMASQELQLVVLQRLINIAIQEHYYETCQSKLQRDEAVLESCCDQDLVNTLTDEMNNILSEMEFPLIPKQHNEQKHMLLSAMRSVMQLLDEQTPNSSPVCKPRAIGPTKLVSEIDTDQTKGPEVELVLRHVHTRALRELQTRINRAIGQLQMITGNPKTSQKLSKVGW